MKKRTNEIKRVLLQDISEIDGEVICKIKIRPEKHIYYKGVELEKIDELFQNIKTEYEIMGVWALYGKTQESWECLQVAQKANVNIIYESIGCEIVEDLQLMFEPEIEECRGCKDLKYEDRAFYTQVYKRHLCEECQQRDKHEEFYQKRFHARKNLKRKDRIINLARRFDMYHQIADEYSELLVCCVYKSNENNCIKKQRKTILNKEKEYAQKYQAIYFR